MTGASAAAVGTSSTDVPDSVTGRGSLFARLADNQPLLLEIFVAGNLAGLTLDIYVAHSVNRFRHWTEWIPFWFAGVGALLLFGNLARVGLRRVLRGRRRGSATDGQGGHPPADGSTGRDPGSDGAAAGLYAGVGRWLGFLVGFGGIAVGVAGLLLHLDSAFFHEATLRNLVYSAPFVAPLAFAGLGFLLLLNRMVPHDSVEWAAWIVLLALGGFVGNFALSVVDHAQNGFFYAREWIPVFAAALAVGWLTVVVMGEARRAFLRWGLWVMALQAVVGLVGFYWHVAPVFHETQGTLWNRIVFGAPVFAPMLFAVLAVLGGLGMWALMGRTDGREPATAGDG